MSQKQMTDRELLRKRIREAIHENDSMDYRAMEERIGQGRKEPIRIGVYHCIGYHPEQPSSLELFKLYYEDAIARIPGAVFKGLYLDTYNSSLCGNNVYLDQLLEACWAGEIDVIWTKSLSIFCRNTDDPLGVIKSLADLDPLVGILFYTQGMYSLNESCIMDLSEEYMECGLPGFLRDSINRMKDAWYKVEHNIPYLHWDCDYCELQSEINNAEVNGMISSEQAWYLRHKFLRMEEDRA